MGPRVALFLVFVCSSIVVHAQSQRFLLPIFYNGPGAYGTHWTSEFNVWAEDHGLVREVGFETRLQGGFFTNLTRPDLPRLVRVREASSLGPAALVPVVPESDFRHALWIPAVLAGPGRVVTLRVYSVEATDFTLSIGAEQQQLRTVKNRPLGPAFASLDLSHLTVGEYELILQSSAGRVWAMASTFDLVTRDLTVRTPARHHD